MSEQKTTRPGSTPAMVKRPQAAPCATWDAASDTWETFRAEYGDKTNVAVD